MLNGLFLKGRNLIEVLEKDCFFGLVHLKTLDLSENKLVELRSADFLGLSNLEELNITNNPISNAYGYDVLSLNDLNNISKVCNTISCTDNSETIEKIISSVQKFNSQSQIVPDIAKIVNIIEIIELVNIESRNVEYYRDQVQIHTINLNKLLFTSID